MSAIILHFAPMAKAAENLPNRIRYFRERAAVSQQELADRIHTSKVTISSLEKGKMQLTLDYMRRIAKVFGITPVDLLNEDDQNEFLRSEEMELIRLWRMADPLQREMIHRVAEPRAAFDHTGHAETPENGASKPDAKADIGAGRPRAA